MVRCLTDFSCWEIIAKLAPLGTALIVLIAAPRRQIAITKASVTSCAVIAALIDQPTTRREKRSMTAAT